MTIEEIAGAIEASSATVRRDLKIAETRLYLLLATTDQIDRPTEAF